ncbi:hypothetical protein ABLV51_19725 [Klebsiella sp. GB_Kp051]|uniref:hypothetical protein n=1 Tax=Klebsiella sp. GB_Kp051 TaxID=3153402 RepID=UPI0032B326D9
MTKQIFPAELAEIVTALLVKPELLGELDTRVAHQEFMKAIGCVVADFCGGAVNGVTDGDISRPYLSDVDCTPCLHIEADDRLPSPDHNVWANYHIEGWQEGDDIEAVSVPVSVKSQRAGIQGILSNAGLTLGIEQQLQLQMVDWRIAEDSELLLEDDGRPYTATLHIANQTSLELVDSAGESSFGLRLEINHGVPALHLNVAGGDNLLHIHVAQGGLILTPDHSGVQIGSAEPDRYAYYDNASLLVRT